MGKYVLAMYDVRGKQDYIFRGNKIKEIVGASLVIRDIYKDYLLIPENKIINDTDAEFSWDSFTANIQSGNNGEVLYDGGGNFLVLFKDEQTFKEITHRFTLTVLEKTASLRVIGTCVEIDGPDNFEKDRKALYEKHRNTENTIQNVPLYASLPISLVHPNSSLPIVYRGKDYTKEEIELTAEQLAKYQKYAQCINREQDRNEFEENTLDMIAPDKGTDSHIAVIYIDGNSMGAKVQECTRNVQSPAYDAKINALRDFSKHIQEEFIDNKKAVIDSRLREIYGDKEKAPKRRLILGAGDEINMIVAGRDAFEVAKTYLEALEDGFSSCAGIAVFKSHMPYADAYRIAEECCESGKNKMKELGLQNTSFIDFHMCQGAIDVSLEQIRHDEETEDISRPWLIVDKGEEAANSNLFSIEEIETVKDFLQKIGHGNTKGLLAASRAGARELSLELKRIRAHQSDKKKKEMEKDWRVINSIKEDRLYKIVYDVVLMYDLWFM